MFETSSADGRWELRLKADVTSDIGEESVVHLANQALSSGIRVGVVDISEVRFMNSSGIALLLRLMTKFRQKGGELFILRPPERIRRLLLMTRLESIFPIINSTDEAQLPPGKP